MTERCKQVRSMMVIAAVVVGCSGMVAQRASANHKTDSPSVIEWEGRSAAVEKALKDDESFWQPGHSIAILDAFGTEHDALSAALVDCCQGGAYSDGIIVMRLEAGVPVIAKFRDRNGKPVPNAFLNGASVMHTVSVKLVPQEKAVLDFAADNDSEGKPAHCDVKAYVWHAATKTFDLNQKVSRAQTTRECAEWRSQFHLGSGGS